MRRQAFLITSSLALAAALPAAAPAQGPPLPPAPPVAPQPAAGKMSLVVKNGLPTRKARYFMRGQRVLVVSRVKPFVPGQVAVLEYLRRGKVIARKRAAIRPASGAGRAVFRFKLRRRGTLRLRARHRPTPQQRGFRSRAVRLKAGVFRAGQGARGAKVVLLQRALKRMGFAVPVSGYYDAGTSRAVLAYRKTNGLGRDGYATPRVYSRVFRRRGAFRPRFPRAGRHVEFDWSRQVLVLVRKGRAYRVYHASSGKASTPTVFGAFRFYRKQPGVNSLGMVHSNYFIRGYAIHGYASVPSYPASHGCIRVPIPNAAQIDRWIALGQRVFVYR